MLRLIFLWITLSSGLPICEYSPPTTYPCQCLVLCSGFCTGCCPAGSNRSNCGTWPACCGSPCVPVEGYLALSNSDHPGDTIRRVPGFLNASEIAPICDNETACLGFMFPTRDLKTSGVKTAGNAVNCFYSKKCTCSRCGSTSQAIGATTCGSPSASCSATSEPSPLPACWGSVKDVGGICDCNDGNFSFTFSPTTSPTTASPTTTSPTTSPTQAPSMAPTNFTGSDSDFCRLIEAGDLQAECVVPTPGTGPTPATAPTPPPTYTIVSPLVNITVNESSTGPFIFTLPINSRIKDLFSSPDCFQPALKCEWQDPENLTVFRQSGCEVTEGIDLGFGVKGAKCTCSHLTVFALVLRNEFGGEALCQAGTADYVLLALYGFLVVLLLIQIGRLVRAKSFALCFIQHNVLLTTALLRVAFLAAKPLIESLAGLVFLGLLPSALSLSLFLHLLLAWASLRLFSFESSPFAKLRIPFLVLVGAVFLLACGITIAVAVTNSNNEIDIVTSGSYVLAAVYACVCIMVLLAGLGLNKMLVKSSSGSVSFEGVRIRILISSVGISVCLLLGACLWVAAIQSEILASAGATLAVSTCFYVVDWVSLVMLTALCSFAVKNARKFVPTARSM